MRGLVAALLTTCCLAFPPALPTAPITVNGTFPLGLGRNTGLIIGKTRDLLFTLEPNNNLPKLTGPLELFRLDVGDGSGPLRIAESAKMPFAHWNSATLQIDPLTYVVMSQNPDTGVYGVHVLVGQGDLASLVVKNNVTFPPSDRYTYWYAGFDDQQRLFYAFCGHLSLLVSVNIDSGALMSLPMPSNLTAYAMLVEPSSQYVAVCDDMDLVRYSLPDFRAVASSSGIYCVELSPFSDGIIAALPAPPGGSLVAAILFNSTLAHTPSLPVCREGQVSPFTMTTDNSSRLYVPGSDGNYNGFVTVYTSKGGLDLTCTSDFTFDIDGHLQTVNQRGDFCVIASSVNGGNVTVEARCVLQE